MFLDYKYKKNFLTYLDTNGQSIPVENNKIKVKGQFLHKGLNQKIAHL